MKEVKVKILNMTYDKDNHLFQMHIEELVGDHKEVVLAVSGTDFGIPKGCSIEVVDNFCKAMVGKEKNLHIQKDPNSIGEIKKNEEGKISQEEVNRVVNNLGSDNIHDYPIEETYKSLRSKEDINES